MSFTNTLRWELRAVAAALVATAKSRLTQMGFGGYLLLWVMLPILNLCITGLIYANRPALLAYSAVAIAANAIVFSCIFYSGEILDSERLTGTLRALFLAPCSRFSWLLGGQLVGLLEGFAITIITLIFARVVFDVRLDANLPSVVVVLALFVILLWGFSLIIGAIGLLLKQANQLSNLIFPFVLVLGGVQYPVSLLPDWLRLPARALPFGYGFEALAAAMLNNASLPALIPQLVPLTGFAIVLPVAGIVTFRWLERVVRARGELDLY
ncbi:MAG: ABC transporter permease [Chloroflexota bacterium]|nr:ABC transporter permease [Chloroflexota bacterium]